MVKPTIYACHCCPGYEKFIHQSKCGCAVIGTFWWQFRRSVRRNKVIETCLFLFVCFLPRFPSHRGCWHICLTNTFLNKRFLVDILMDKFNKAIPLPSGQTCLWNWSWNVGIFQNSKPLKLWIHSFLYCILSMSSLLDFSWCEVSPYNTCNVPERNINLTLW